MEGEKEVRAAENNESAELLAVIKRHEWGATPILFAYDPDKRIASATFKSSSGGMSVVNAKCENGGYCHVYDSCMTTEELAWKNMHTHNVMEPPQSSGTPQTAERTVEGDKSDAKHAKAITMLNAKLVKLQNEAHKYDDCNRLSRKLYFSDAKRQVRIGEQCTAIEAALALLNGKQWHELDIYNVVLMSVNSRNSEKDKMLEYAYSGGLYEKQKALIYAFETSLPICKKQIFEAIQMQIKNSRLAQTA